MPETYQITSMLILRDICGFLSFISGALIFEQTLIYAFTGRENKNLIDHRFNYVKWSLFGLAGVVLGLLTLLSSKVIWIGPHTLTYQLCATFGWVCFASSLVMRAVSLSCQPRLTGLVYLALIPVSLFLALVDRIGTLCC